MGNLQELSDLKKTVKISERRFEESPFIERTNSPNMVRGVYAGRYFPMSIGEDPIKKYWLLRQKALIFDVPEKPIEITGQDSLKFLNKVLTRDVSTFKGGRGYYSLACTPQGGIFMDGVIFKFNENKYWYVQADGPFEEWLLAHSSNFDVKICDPKSRVLQIQGPASIDIMKKASNGKIDENFKYYRCGFFDLGGQNLFVSRTGFTNELGFEIYTEGSKTDHLALWDHLMNCGKPYGMEFSAARAMTIRRIEGGILGNLTDIDTTINPFEAGLAFCVNLEKNNFIGRDALLKKDRRLRIKRRVRKIIFGTSERPRLTVFRSNKEIYASLVDDTIGKVLCSTSSLSKAFKSTGTKIEKSKDVGKKIAELAISKGINECCFDRNGYLYHGRVKSLADGAREAGLKL